MGVRVGRWEADWVKGEIEFHKIRENGKETEMVETNFLPSRGLLQGKVKETFDWKEEDKFCEIGDEP